MSNITLTEEQSSAIKQIHDWFLQPNQQEFFLGGYAGTGKTTIIKFLLNADPLDMPTGIDLHAIVCAFTGKACHVLRKKGIHSAATIHSTIYDCEEVSKGVYEFYLKTTLPSKPNLIIIDEASMISTDLYRDLKSFGIKLLFIGDPGQLEPVGDNPNLMKSPNYVLSKIHRQAEGNPIIALASGVRNGTAVRLVPLQHNAHVFIKPKFTDAELLCSADQVICAKNATRSLLNSRIRAHLNHPSGTIIPGDKLICLRNNRQFRMFNGLICTVESIERDYFDHWICNLRDEADVLYENIPVWKAPLVGNLDPGTQPPRGLLYFDFGYAITCHKSQGSEWPHVLVYDEVMFKTDMRRWRYTAITRASEKLTYCI